MTAEQEFQNAIKRVTDLKIVPCFGLRLALWMLYKQAKYGDYKPEKMGDVEEKYREDSELLKKNGWGTLSGKTKEQARANYVELADIVVKHHS